MSCSALAALNGLGVASAMIATLNWQELPELPPGRSEIHQPGVAGPFAGTSHGVLLVGGGANFPDRPPWDGGAKAWRDDVFVWEPSEPNGSGGQWILSSSYRLPHPMGYGVSFTTPEGVVCAGGCDGQRCYREVFLLEWNRDRRQIESVSLPELPAPLAMMSGAQIGSTLYLVGGQREIAGAKPTRTFWSLDLAERDRPEKFHWVDCEPWPGPPRVVPVAAAQAGKLYLFSGRVQAEGEPTQLLNDAFVFDPAEKQWRHLRDIEGERRDGSDGRCLMAGVAMPVGPAEILVTSGDRGAMFLRLEELDFRAAAARKAGNQRELAAAWAEKRELSVHHAGFGREVLAYDTATDRWRRLPPSPVPSQVTTLAVPWGGGWIIPNGEVRPAVRTARVTWLRPQLAQP